MKTCITLFSLVLCFSLSSCGSDDDSPGSGGGGGGGNANCNAEWFAEQTNIILTNGLAYGLSATDENCKKYKESIELWIDAAEDCDNSSQADLDEARMDLEELDCN